MYVHTIKKQLRVVQEASQFTDLSGGPFPGFGFRSGTELEN
jgi:hypothetical protein